MIRPNKPYETLITLCAGYVGSRELAVLDHVMKAFGSSKIDVLILI